MTSANPMPAPSILLIGNYPPDGQQSMRRYAEFLYEELLARGYSVSAIKPEAVFGRRFPDRGPISRWMGTIDKYVIFPLRLRMLAAKYSIAHICDHSNAHYLQYLRRDTCLVTCHDLFGIKSELGHYPETAGPTSLKHRRRMAWTLSSLKAAKNIVCVSGKTSDDLVELLQKRPPLLVTIPHSLNWKFAPLSGEQTAALLSGLDPRIGKKYFIHVGSNQWYKNRAGVIKIFLALKKFPEYRDAQLVMAGKSWTPEMHALREAAGDDGQDILEIVGPTNEQVQALYSGAIALLFPSLYEGFGWPILEAQACGCPVATSNRAPMMEIAGESAVLIDPARPELAAAEIEEGLQRRSHIVAAGFENLKRYDKTAVMDRYCNLYEEIALGSRASRSS